MKFWYRKCINWEIPVEEKKTRKAVDNIEKYARIDQKNGGFTKKDIEGEIK
jgi:hypothetical protein